jgi:hypothetical protein
VELLISSRILFAIKVNGDAINDNFDDDDYDDDEEEEDVYGHGDNDDDNYQP